MILLDTHVLIWMQAEPKRLSHGAAGAIRSAQQESSTAVSAITLWEVASLVARGRIRAYGTVEASVRLLTEGIVLKMITPEIAAVAAQFTADFPRDPAGRLIAAMARVESIPLITRDEGLRSSPLLQTIW